MVRCHATDATSVVVESVPPLIDPHEAADLPFRPLHQPRESPLARGVFTFWVRVLWHKAAMTSSRPKLPAWPVRHLAEVGESYGTHARFALRIAARCVWTAVLLAVHAVLPFLLVRKGSESLARIQADVAARGGQSR